MKRITKSDYVDRTPEVEEWVDKLKTVEQPPVAVRKQRGYWWSVEYVAWIDGRWYGCVQNWYEEEDCWETTDVGEYDVHQAYGIVSDGLNPAREGTVQLVPLRETPLQK